MTIRESVPLRVTDDGARVVSKEAAGLLELPGYSAAILALGPSAAGT